jgi:serine/threonine-protein kinase
MGSRVGSTFGPYDLRSLIGVGGMGEVFEAYDTVRQRIVAVKLLRPELAVDAGFQERFRRESRVAARLQDPHVIPVHDFGEIGGVLYIDMRLIRGTNLKHVLRQRGLLDPSRAASIITQVASALDAAHAEGLVHRDVKPENVLLTPKDFAYLADFGIVHASGDPGLTATGAAIGSCTYMAPERFSGGLGPQVDVYALACLLYECLTGRPPFPVADLGQLMSAHLLSPPPRPSMTRPGLSPAFDDVIARGMAKQPAARFESAGQLAQAATAAASSPPPTSAHAHPVTATGTRQFSTVFPSPSATGYTPYAPPAQASENSFQRRGVTRWQFLLATAAVIALISAALVAAFALLRNNDSAPSSEATLPPTKTSTLPTTVTEFTTNAEPTTTQSTVTTPSTTAASSTTPSGARLPVTDSQGFVGYYARCDSGSTPAVLAQTNKSLVAVCQAGSGDFYYRAVRMSDGASIQLADAQRTSGGFDVTNPADGTRYEVRPNVVNIVSPGGLVESEPVVRYSSS